MPPKRKRTSNATVVATKSPLHLPVDPTPSPGVPDELDVGDESSHHQDEDEGQPDEDENPSVAMYADCPFKIEYITSKKLKAKKKGKPAEKKRRISTKDHALAEDNIDEDDQLALGKEYPEDNATIYSVQPKDEWAKLKKFRRFVGKLTQSTVYA